MNNATQATSAYISFWRDIRPFALLVLLSACGGGGGSSSIPSTDATLSDLSISAGTLVSAFSATTLTYAVTVSNATASVTVTPTASSGNATITVNNVAVASSASAAIALADGANTINVAVTAQDGTTNQIYTVTVTRRVAPSTDPTLSSLTLSDGTHSAYSPSYLSVIAANNTFDVSTACASVDVTAVTASANATMTVNGAAVASGTLKSVSVPVGLSTITIDVIAQDGTTTQTYTITLTRLAIALSPVISNIAALSAATITVTLAKTAVADTTVTLLSSNPATITVPASVTVLAGTTNVSFSAVSVASVSATELVTATLGADSVTAGIIVVGQCVAASDCGVSSLCQTRTCIAGMCGIYNSPAGPSGTQFTGDCQQLQCDGAGSMSFAINNTDVPVDGNVCTSDVCTAGISSNPWMVNGTTCILANSAATCTSGACIISSCSSGFKDCNAMSADGCEINTISDVNNCGNCGIVCPVGLPACVAGVCQ